MTNDELCPLCGNQKKEDELFCSTCRADASKQTLNFEKEQSNIEFVPIEPKIDAEYTKPKVTSKQQKTNRKLIIFFLGGCALCIILYAVSSYISTKEKYADQTELMIWNTCIEKNTPPEYSQYLIHYPNGKFVKDAITHIETLRQKEQQDWLKVLKSTDLNTCYAFLNDYPETPHKEDVKSRMDSLSWILASNADTKDALKAYIENAKLGNITGSYVPMAQDRYNYLTQIQPLTGTGLDSIKTIVGNVLNALSDKKLKGLNNLLAPQVSNFYENKYVSNTRLVDSIQTDCKNKKIQSISYKPDYSTLTAKKDNKNTCFIQFKLDREDIYSKKKKIQLTQSVYMELNSEGRVQCFYKK